MFKRSFIILVMLSCFTAPAAKHVSACSCNCYYTPDCEKFYPTKPICDRTKCGKRYKKPKPDRIAGKKGCTGNHDRKNKCDGLCVKEKSGSRCGFRDRPTLGAAIELLGESFIQPAETGGGLADAGLVQIALNSVGDSECLEILGYQVGGVLLGFAGDSFWQHPEEEHSFDDHSVADLSAFPCMVQALRLRVDALVAEINSIGAGDSIIDLIPQVCPDVLDSMVSCESLDALTCLKNHNRALAEFLTTTPAPLPIDCDGCECDARLAIDVARTLSGQLTEVSISRLGGSIFAGGFDLLIWYDPSALSFLRATRGALLDSLEWEYWTYRHGAAANCTGGCPDGLVRLVAIADLDNGPQQHPTFSAGPGVLESVS